MSSPMLLLTPVFLLAVLHASTAWDESNIWFPDVNNPVFYNMTFYQEAAKAVNRHKAESAMRPTAVPAEQQRPSWTRFAPPRRVKTQQAGVQGNRIPAEQNFRNREPSQEAVGFRSQSFDDRASQMADSFNNNNMAVKVNRQPSGNRLQRQDEERMVNYDTRFPQPASSQQETRRGGENRRDWNNRGMGSEATNTVEGDILSAIETTSKSSGPSKCVWAIISCCKPTSTEIRYMCFETLGCHGAFWDNNPCSKEMTRAAVRATANFYNVPVTTDE